MKRSERSKRSVSREKVHCPKSLWQCRQCSGKLLPVNLTRSGDGPDALISASCSVCGNVHGVITNLRVRCLWSKRLKPEQGELAELAVRYKLVVLQGYRRNQ